MNTAIWPKDFLGQQHDIEKADGNRLVVFLISPFHPADRFDGVFQFCQSVCADVGRMIGAAVECVRGDTPSNPTVIHGDIWAYIQNSDAIIADVSDENGNVMFELGVAAAVREKEQIIIINDRDTTQRFLFDIQPARHLAYCQSLSGASDFREELTRALMFALAPAPFTRDLPDAIPLATDLDMTRPDHCSFLIGPANAFRRRHADGLEHGSLFAFRFSWLTFTKEKFKNVQVTAKMKFTQLRSSGGAGWIGIMLRSQHFFANNGHLIYLTSDGLIHHTKPIHEFDKHPSDPVIGSIDGFDPDEWVEFDIIFNDEALFGSVGGVPFHIDVSEMPFVHNAGLVRFQTFLARACIGTLRVGSEIPQPNT